MSNLQKMGANAIQIYTPDKKAITVRRDIINVPGLRENLTRLEYYIFLASTKKQISEFDDQTLIERFKELFRLIAVDYGYIITDDFQYLCTRIYDWLKKYYHQLTLAEIKIAFELAISGKLDEFLPKGRDGSADRNHYQQFNIDFFSKILNAYCLKQKNVISKAFTEIEKIQRIENINPNIKIIDRYTKNKLYKTVLFYKYRGKLPEMTDTSVRLFYDILLNVGLIETHDIIIDDKKEALSLLMTKISNGFMSDTSAYQLRKKGIEHDEVKVLSLSFARKRILIKSFDYIIENEIQLIDYLK